MFSEDPANIPLGEAEIKNETGEEGEEVEGGEQVPPKKNHQERRWDKLFTKLEEQGEKLTEYEQFKRDVETGKFSSKQSEVPDHFKKLFEDGLTVEDRWKAHQEYETRREQEIQERVLGQVKHEEAEKKRWGDFIDEKLEDLEEKYDIDFTSGSAKAERMKREFLSEVVDFSPKDEHDNIISYAPFEKVYERWSASKLKPDTTVARKKDISALSGQRSSSAQPQEQEAGNGGWFGWMGEMKK